jgi:hypothetical protein
MGSEEAEFFVELFSAAGRAANRRVGTYEELELLGAALAFVFENRHMPPLIS